MHMHIKLYIYRLTTLLSRISMRFATATAAAAGVAQRHHGTAVLHIAFIVNEKL